MTHEPPTRKRRFSWLSLIGPVLLLVLLWQLDTARLLAVIQRADWRLLLLAVALNLPMVLLKSLRWQALMYAQQISYHLGSAYLAYFGSIFIGFLTPGRLGEFVKALHVSRDCRVSIGQAFSSVLVDRLLDFYVLLIVGGSALLSLVVQQNGSLTDSLVGLALLMLLAVVPLACFLNDGIFGFVQQQGKKIGRVGRWLFAPESPLLQLRQGFKQLSWGWLLAGVALTICANGVFFGQCYLLAYTLGLSLSFVQVASAVALGSLITLIPVSISGMGTREATIIAYLGTAGVAAEQALGFSLLVFATFYAGGGLLGAVAWWLKPVPLSAIRQPGATNV